MSDLVVATLTITRRLTEDGDTVDLDIEPDDLDIVSALGMIRLAEDTVIRRAMGEIPEED